MNPQWFALQVYSGREKWIAAQLAKSAFPILLPLTKQVRKWSDRTKVLLIPLFPGYLFCHMDIRQRHELAAKGLGVLRIVGCGNEPEPVPDAEIESLQKLVESGRLLEPWPYIAGGAEVRISGGALHGVVGTFVEVKKNRRIVVSVNPLQRSVAVELDSESVSLFRMDLPAVSMSADHLAHQ